MALSIPVYFLLAAAVLGFVIGWFVNRIWSIRSHNQVVNEGETRLRRMNRRLQVMTEDYNLLESRLHKARLRLSHAESHQSEDSEKRDAELEKRLRRIEELESKAYTQEEQYMRLQRDFAKFKLVKTREVEQLTAQLSAVGGAVGAASAEASDDVPILSKKAQTAPEVSQPAASGLPDITHEVLEFEEDLMDMTSEFDFDPKELLSKD